MNPLDPQTTALVLIDLQNGILGQPLAPHSRAAIVQAGGELAARFRRAGAQVVLVNVAFAPDFKDALRAPVDRPFARPTGGLPPDYNALAEGLQQPGDLCITKRQWGAFYGTDLDLQLRRRGIQTIVLGGRRHQFRGRIHRAPGLGTGLCAYHRGGRHDQPLRRTPRVCHKAHPPAPQPHPALRGH